MTDDQEVWLRARIEQLEAQLGESEEMLGAIRRGEVDALVLGEQADDQQVYTLNTADRPYRVLIEQIQEGAATLAEDGTVLYCNRRLADLLGTAQERVIGQSLGPYVPSDDRPILNRLLHIARHARSRSEIVFHTPTGSETPVYVSLSPLHNDDGSTLLCGVFTDLTEQKVHLRELADANARLIGEIAQREQLEEALRQAQKMEAVGQLTGGLAHDFNNLLTGITGSLELLQTRIAQGRIADVPRYVTAAQGAANRAAALTHRLLAFSRRQTLDPKPTDLNRLVAGMEELIRRTVGPEILIESTAAGDLWPTLVDPGQLENALLNLCINARDAMPDGGRLAVETGNCWLDQPEALERDLPAGHYVSLRVADTGTGMPPDVIAKAFEPFFTTKPIGMGTGLGLSMIYGFAKQSGGQVRIHSEIGQGTTVSLFLPRHLGQADVPTPPIELAHAPRAEDGQTVLVIDDEVTVRMLVTEVLMDLGYRAIEAADGAEGLQVLNSDLRIDLLVSDVGLPGGMNGRQVADAARVKRPDLKVLFITGYAENAVFSHAQLEAGMHIMIKPFSMDALANRVKDLIAGS